jgi:hypothetical protein
MPRVVEHIYRPRGGFLDLFDCREPEVLTEGPAGTGKSRGWGEYLNWVAEEHPGARILVARDTRASLTESFLVTFEERVLLPDSPLLDGPSREHRHSYDYPNGSTIVLGGLDKPTRLYSTEWDIVYINEATEVSLDAWERFHRSLRNGVVPWQQLGGDCNPDHPMHWLNLRCESRMTRRIVTTHRDNPLLYTDGGALTEFGRVYMGKLDLLTGVRRARLRDGRWVAAEGMIFDNFDRAVHSPEWLTRDKVVPWWKWKDADRDAGRIKAAAYVVAVDWGLRAPGCMQLWAITQEQEWICVEEVYRTEKTVKEFWAPLALRWHREYRPLAFVCDPEEPGHIKDFRAAGLPAKEADNAFQPGRDDVLDALAVPDSGPRKGRPRARFCRDMLSDREESLAQSAKPTGFLTEVWQYVYRKAEDGKPIKEEPDPGCADHACDVTRYAVRFLNRLGEQRAPEGPRFQRGSMGDVLGHEEVLARSEGRV